jgi:nitrate/nitrite transporter NarK
VSDKKRNVRNLFGVGAIGACAVCCAPLIAPFIVGAGIASVAGMMWLSAAIVAVVVGYLFYRKTRPSQSCDLHSGCGCKEAADDGAN